MSRMFLVIFTALFILLSGCSDSYIEYKPQVPAIQRTIKWREYSETTLVISYTSKKPIFIYFYLEKCIGCELMSKLTFSDPEAVYFIMENYVPIKVGPDREDIMDKYGVTSFPTIIILSSFANNVEMAKISKYVNSKSLLAILTVLRNVNVMLDDKLLNSLGVHDGTF